MTLATSYAFGDVFGMRHSLHRGIREAKFFYGTYAGMVAVAGAIVLIANDSILGLITTAVQALAGILLPSASVFLVLLCNDRDVIGPWINKTWLNVVASGIVSILLMLSLILVITTSDPVDRRHKAARGPGAASWQSRIAPGEADGCGRGQSRGAPQPDMSAGEKENWRMPPLHVVAAGRPGRRAAGSRW